MIQITRGQANTITVTATEKVTLASPVFLFRFIKDSTLVENTVIATNTSAYTDRYDTFSITESDTENRANGALTLKAGDWHYEIYEQTGSGLTVTGNKLEDGVCKVTDNSLGTTYIEHREATTYVE